MHSPYIQVMLTYLRHPFDLLQQYLFLTIILYIFAMLVLPGLFIEEHMFASSQLFLFIILSLSWAIHVKEQFADCRASLTPGFRKVHGVVAGIVASVLVILLPGIIALLSGSQPLELFTITTFLFGIILWAVLRLGNSFIFLIWTGWFFTLFEPIQSVIEKVVSGNAFTFLCVGAALSITGTIRLFLLNEEKPEYHLSLKKTIEGGTKLSVQQWQKPEKSSSRGWWKWIASRMIANVIYDARHATDSYWSRMHRWNYSNHSVLPALCYAAFIYLFLMLIYFLTGGTFLPGIRIWWATFMPAILVNVIMNEKNHFMVQDLMMPVRRDAYLKQVGMSFAATHFIHWGAFLIVSFLSMLADSTKPSHEFITISISYSLMTQIWLYGLAIWINSHRSIMLNVLAFIAAFLLVTVSFMSAFKPQMTIPWWPLILGTLLACHGLLLIWWGYRRWMTMDFS